MSIFLIIFVVVLMVYVVSKMEDKQQARRDRSDEEN
jgi:uncharacterized membrane protein